MGTLPLYRPPVWDFCQKRDGAKRKGGLPKRKAAAHGYGRELWNFCLAWSIICCCAAGVLSVLADNNLSRKVTLAAGQLVLQGVTLLGTLGNVLVLANDEDQRIYFVCAAKVQFLG